MRHTQLEQAAEIEIRSRCSVDLLHVYAVPVSQRTAQNRSREIDGVIGEHLPEIMK
jgi:hypothetical protein